MPFCAAAVPGDVLHENHARGDSAPAAMTRRNFRSMAKIQVVPAPASPSAAHDLDGEGGSDIFWRDAGGNLALRRMNGVRVSSSLGLGAAPSGWSVVAQE